MVKRLSVLFIGVCTAAIMAAVPAAATNRHSVSPYRLGQRSVCQMILNDVKRGELAIEVLSDPGAVCSRLGFVVLGNNQRMRLADCGSAANVRWLGLGRGAVCRIGLS